MVWTAPDRVVHSISRFEAFGEARVAQRLPGDAFRELEHRRRNRVLERREIDPAVEKARGDHDRQAPARGVAGLRRELALPRIADDRGLSGRHAAEDAGDVARFDAPIGEDARRFDERMQEVAARVELERGIRQVPHAPEVADHAPEPLGGLVVPREMAEQPVAAFEGSLGSAHARTRERGREHAGVRRPARMQRFHRRAVGEKLEHTRCLAERDAGARDALVFGQAAELRSHQRRSERAADRRDLEAAPLKSALRRQTEAHQDLPAPDVRSEQRRPARAVGLRGGQRRRGNDRAAMDDRRGVRVVVLEAVHQAAVDERGVGRRSADPLPQHRGRPAGCALPREAAVRCTDGRARRSETDAERIEEVKPRSERDVLRQWPARDRAARSNELAREGHALALRVCRAVLAPVA